MAYLPAKELAAMRSDLLNLQPETCVIQALTLTADGQGNYTEAWTAAGTVTARLDNSGGGKQQSADSQRTYSAWTLTVPHDAGLTTANRVVIGGYTYSVMDVSDAPSWVGVQRARVERVA